MRPKLLAGLFAVALLAVPGGAAQRGGMGGGSRAAAPSGGMSFAGVAPHAGNVRSVSSVPVANSPFVARPHAANPFSAYGVQTPYRAAGIPGGPTMGIREPHSSGISGGGIGVHHHHPHQPKGTNPGFYFLTGGGYWYAGPGLVDDAEGQPEGADGQESVEGQQADDQQQQPADEQGDARADINAAPVPEPQAAPLPDVGSFTLVMRDGTQVDAVAFTRAQDKLIYITPDGGRRTVAVRDIDGNSTERVNQERGTPLQLPL
jgi:hypothetical protein